MLQVPKSNIFRVKLLLLSSASMSLGKVSSALVYNMVCQAFTLYHLHLHDNSADVEMCMACASVSQSWALYVGATDQAQLMPRPGSVCNRVCTAMGPVEP